MPACLGQREHLMRLDRLEFQTPKYWWWIANSSTWSLWTMVSYLKGAFEWYIVSGNSIQFQHWNSLWNLGFVFTLFSCKKISFMFFSKELLFETATFGQLVWTWYKMCVCKDRYEHKCENHINAHFKKVVYIF